MPNPWQETPEGCSRLLAFFLVAALFIGGSPARCWGEIADARFYGSDRRLHQQLDSPLSVHWQGVPLRAALERLGKTTPVSFWLDRRIDPTTEVSIVLRNGSIRILLGQITDQTDLGISASRNIVYLGPPQAARELRTLWALSQQQVEELKVDLQKKMRHQAALTLPRLAKPREVVEQLLQQMGVRAENLQAIPFDLRPASRLPSMARVDQLTLLLQEFNLTWEPLPNGQSIRIIPIQRPLLVERTHSQKATAKISDPRFRDPLAGATARESKTPGKQRVAALVEQHELLRGQRSTRPTNRQPPRPSVGKQAYSLRVDQKPAEAILRQLARQLQMELTTAEDSPKLQAALKQRISFEVQQASLAELLNAIGKEVNLDIQATERGIEISE